jgi:hypothetical protein
MPPRIPSETIDFIELMYKEGCSPRKIARIVGIDQTTAWGFTELREAGYDTKHEYYVEWAEGRGFQSFYDYLTNLVKKRNFASYPEYQKHLGELRQTRPANVKLSGLITDNLERVGRSQAWLSREIGVGKSMVAFYVKGTNLPSEAVAKRLFLALNLPYQTLDDFMKEVSE